MSTHYHTLGLRINATAEELRARHRKLVLKYHPDRNPGGTTTFKHIQTAYEVLNDPTKCRRYDEMLCRSRPFDGRFRPFGKRPITRDAKEIVLPEIACIGIARFPNIHNFAISDGTRVQYQPEYKMTSPNR